MDYYGVIQHKHIDNIMWLKVLARPYPSTAGKILEIAALYGFSTSTTDFLLLFRKDFEFKDENNFLYICEEMEDKLIEIHSEILVKNMAF
jgi:hypothetical protein